MQTTFLIYYSTPFLKQERVIFMAYFRKFGDKWYYTIEINRADGKRKRVERVGGRTKKEAQAAYREAIENMNHYGVVKKPVDIIYSDFLNFWLEDYVKINLSTNTLNSYRSIIKNHIIPALGDYKLINISPLMIQTFLNKKATKYTKGSLFVMCAVLKKSMSYAVQPCQYLKSSPAEYFTMPKKREEKPKVTYSFNKQELQLIFDKFPFNHQFYLPIMIAYYTGLRLGECLALRWSDIKEKDNMLTVNHTLIDKVKPPKLSVPKSKSSIRTIPFGNELHKILHLHHIKQKEKKLAYGKYYKDSDFVCTLDDGTLMTSDDMRFFGMFCHNKISPNASFHSLRHTHATMLVESGVDLDYVSKRLGHSSIAITAKIYSHVTNKRHEDAMKIINKIL